MQRNTSPNDSGPNGGYLDLLVRFRGLVHTFLLLFRSTLRVFRGTNPVLIFETRLLDAHFGLPFKSLERAFCVLIENKR